MNNADILREIALYFNCDMYKNTLLVCNKLYVVIKNREYERLHMNVLSTLILRHPEIDWDVRSNVRYITQEIIDLHIDKFYIPRLSSNPYLSCEFIMKHWGEFSSSIYDNPALTLNMIKEIIATDNINVFMSLIMCNPNLDEAFIRKYWDLYYYHLQHHVNTPFDLIENIDDVDVYKVYSNVNLTNEFIRAKLNYFEDIDTLCENRALTLDIIRDYWDDVFANQDIYENPNITHEFLQELKNEDKINWDDAIINPLISCSAVRDLIADGAIEIRTSSFNPNIDETFIRQYADKLNWFIIVLNNRISLEFAKEYIDYIKHTFAH